MVRGSGKFKTKRGGGRNFSRDMVLDADGVASGEPRRALQEEDVDEDDEEEEDEDEEDEDDDDDDDDEAGLSAAPGDPELSRVERRELKKKQAAEQAAKAEGEDGDEDDLLVNPNRVTKKLNISDLSAPRELTRRERCSTRARAHVRCFQLHLEGKTDQAKADLSRLAKIRAEREAAAAKRKAEAEGQRS
ncbi:casein kinase substrate phosphoprotein PP28-domain-containing protein [Lactarius quietus]|nr:casein kinase substrate phosphoprotein PP28-domain-containing protein [Lactarius quietus]